MKQVFLLFVLVSVLPISQKISITGKTDSIPPVAFHVKTTIGNPFLGRPKAISEVDTSQLKQSGWYAGVVKNMSQAEYNIHKEKNTNAYSSPNRNNNLRFYYDENGFTVEPRTTQIPIGEFDATKRPDEIKYKTLPNWKVAFNLDKKQIGKGTWQVSGNQAEYINDNITIQYINNE